MNAGRTNLRSLVTGGAGFIGSHLVDQLVEVGDEVVVIDNLSTGRISNISRDSHVQFIEADISKPGSWQDSFEGCGRVFHLAALADIVPSIQMPDRYFESNVVGTFNVMQSVRKAGVSKVVYAASSSCYGIPDVFPTPENSPMRPQYPYALTKMLGEEILLHWGQVYSIDVTSLRLFNVFGPRSRTSGTYGAVFGVFLAQKLAGKPLTVVGDGSQTRDFTFVTDVARAFILASGSALGGQTVFNVGSGGTYSVNKLTELIGGEVVHIPKRPGEPDCTFADTTRIRSALGWSPEIRFEEGVQVVLENILGWQDAPVWTPESIADATKDWFKYLSDKK